MKLTRNVVSFCCLSVAAFSSLIGFASAQSTACTVGGTTTTASFTNIGTCCGSTCGSGTGVIHTLAMASGSDFDISVDMTVGTLNGYIIGVTDTTGTRLLTFTLAHQLELYTLLVDTTETTNIAYEAAAPTIANGQMFTLGMVRTGSSTVVLVDGVQVASHSGDTRAYDGFIVAAFNAWTLDTVCGGAASTPSACPTSNPCFSSVATAQVEDKGMTLIKDIKAGDQVLTGSGRFGKVFTVDHKDPSRPTNFLQIHSEASDGTARPPLEMTPNHMIFVDGKKHPIQASNVQVGDKVYIIDDASSATTTTNGISSDGITAEKATVTKIRTVTRDGVWNPITTDGTIVVDGVVTSTYTVAFGDDDVAIANGNIKIMSHHDFIHMLMAPYRAFCTRVVSPSFCDIMDPEDGDGKDQKYSGYSSFGLWVVRFALSMPSMVQDAMVVGSAVVFSILSIALDDGHYQSTAGMFAVALMGIVPALYYYSKAGKAPQM